VSVREPGSAVRYEDLANDRDIAYGVFPFQENRRENRPARSGRNGVKFDVMLRFPAKPYLIEVMTAFRAWILFGGIGARTRRGLGALHCPALFPQPIDRQGQWFRREWQNTWKLPPSGPRPWPVLADAPLLSAPLPGARAAWAKALHQLREFRQGYGTGRDGEPRNPGRSFWPEADSLRMITGRGEYHHMSSLTVDEPAFPRTELGMPIVMRFKGKEDGLNDCNLEPAEPEMRTSRMASPIILRPLPVPGNQYVALVLGLLARKPAGVYIPKLFGKEYWRGASEIERPDLATYPDSPMKGTNGSALDAFMAFARANL
jgi:CRISPR-associated protein Cmr1